MRFCLYAGPASLLFSSIAMPAVAPTEKSAGAYPDRPVRVVVPVAAAGGTDVIARIVMNALSDALAANFVIDNRPGAGGLMGSDIVAKAPPDGYTLLFTYAAHTILPFIYRKVPYDVYRDFAPVTLAGSQPLVVAVNAAIGIHSIEELIRAAKARPGSFNVAWPTPSGSGALAAEVFKRVTNTQMVSVPFKGGSPAMTALAGGEIQLIFTTATSVLPFLQIGKVKMLATTGSRRDPFLPEVPTLAESGVKDMNTSPWQGLLAPANTPGPVVNYLARKIAVLLESTEVKRRFAASATQTGGTTPAEFGAQIARELEQNSKVIRAVGMRAD
jgi:tripartite-type tricarboxylate transporter receptor subunit TctC